MTNIRTIARDLGGDVVGRGSCNVPGPNHSRSDRSLNIRLARDGRLTVHSWCGDPWQDCRDYVLSKLGIGDDWKPSQATAPDHTGDDEARRKAFALKVWANSIDPRATLVETYLRHHRGLKLPDEIANNVIRFHTRLKYEGKYLPGAVALFRDIKSNTPAGIHRVFLDRYDGRKIDRRMLGPTWGAAIKFDEIGSSLVIGEGIETVLAAREAGFKPAWALGSAGAVAFFPVLRQLGEITLLLENDPTSEKFVRVCMDRYRDAGRTVKVVQSHVGSDFNDCWPVRHD